MAMASAAVALDPGLEPEPEPQMSRAEAPERQRSAAGVRELRRAALAHGGELVVSAGSVLDFGGGTDWPPDCIAIVNAANCGGLGGGGVDGAITQAGGSELAAARLALPVLARSGSSRARAERIQTGGSVLTGPGRFGRLHAGNVVHTVGPNYRSLQPDQTPEDGDSLLCDAYRSAMTVAAEAGIQYLGFSLLSAGIFRGMRTLEHVLRIGVEIVRDSAYQGLREVHLIAFQSDEQQVLLGLLEELCGGAAPHSSTGARQVVDTPRHTPPTAAAATEAQISTMLPTIVAACQEYEENPSSGVVDRAVFDVVLKMLELDLAVRQPAEAIILDKCTESGMVDFRRFAELHARRDSSSRQARLDAIQQEIARIYTLHNPQKLCDIDQLLTEWAGREEGLLSRIQEKYCARSPTDSADGRSPATIRSDAEELQPPMHTASSGVTVGDTQAQLRETFGTLKEMERRRAREHPKYIYSAEVEACMHCERQFGFVFGNWQHTCRYCGWVVCSRCSSKTLELNRWVPVHGRSPMTPVDKLREQEPPVPKRVCDSCFEHAPGEMERRREQKRLREEQAALEAEQEDAHEKQEVYALQQRLATMKLRHLTDQQKLSELQAAAADEQTKHARREAEIAAAAAETQRAIAQQQRAERESAYHRFQAAHQERAKAEQERLEATARLQRERDAKAAIEEEEEARQLEALRLSAEGKHFAQMALTNERRQEVARQAAEAAAVEAELARVAAEHRRAELEAALQKAQAAQHEQEIAEQERVEAEARLHSEQAAKAALADAQAATQAERQRLLDEQEHLEKLRVNLHDRKQVAKQKAAVAAEEATNLRLMAAQQSEAAESARQKALAAQLKLATAEDEAREAQHQQDAAKAKALALMQEENTTKTHAENEARERRIASNSAQAAAESRAKMKYLEAAAQDRLKWERSGPDQWTEYSEHDSRALSEQYVALQLRTLLKDLSKTASAGQGEDGRGTKVVMVSGFVDLSTFSHIVVTQPGVIVTAMPGPDDFVPVGRWGHTTGLAKGQGEPTDALEITSLGDCIADPLEITWCDDDSTEMFRPVFSSLQESFFSQCPRRLIGCGGLFQLLDKVKVEMKQGTSMNRHNAAQHVLDHGATGTVVGSTVADDGSVRVRVHLDAVPASNPPNVVAGASIVLNVAKDEKSTAGFTCNDELVVTNVRRGQAAAQAGLQPGMQLLSFQGIGVSTADATWASVKQLVQSTPKPWSFAFSQRDVTARTNTGSLPQGTSFAGEVALKPENLVRVEPARIYSVRGFRRSSAGLDVALSRPVDAFLTRRCENCAGVFGLAEGIECRDVDSQAASLTMTSAAVGMTVCRIDSPGTIGKVPNPVNVANAFTIISHSSVRALWMAQVIKKGAGNMAQVLVDFVETIPCWVLCDKLRAAPCDAHFLCNECFSRHVEGMLQDDAFLQLGCLPITCPHCSGRVAYDEVMVLKHLSVDVSKKLYELQTRPSGPAVNAGGPHSIMVTWECDVDGKWIAYDESIVAVLEKAYQSKDDDCSFKNRGHDYTADLSDRSAPKQVNKATRIVRAMRRAEHTVSEFAPPDSWTGLPQTKNCVLVPVNQTSAEFKQVSGRFLETMPSKTRIVRLERIQNSALWDYYCLRKERMTKVNKRVPLEASVWHGTGNPRDKSAGGTDPAMIYTDVQDGFMMQYCKSGMWGVALYFAEKAVYSHDYSYNRPNGT